MRINSIQQQNKQNFKGNIFDKATKFIADRPGAVAALAGSSVVAQKIIMSGSEAVVGPVMDIGIGKAITAATDEKDGRTNESSKVQAIRTFSQSVGGTIVGVAIRLACIGACTALFMKFGEKAGGAIAQIVNENNLSKKADAYLYQDNMEKWGKNAGGAIATLVMLVTNFIIDAPFINWINKKTTEVVDNVGNKKQAKEVK
ncbi:MAG: hypothetical protein IKL52_02895 [Candidatus Gastranaerophilales bacterium]|nr:hypothetical protein [Candidatus Gastranaerophilales bacterium]